MNRYTRQGKAGNRSHDLSGTDWSGHWGKVCVRNSNSLDKLSS